VTLFIPLINVGSGKSVSQLTGSRRFVVDSSKNPGTFVDHVKIRLDIESAIFNFGGGNVRLNIVPNAVLPPVDVIP
jgi:hypothetical protein